MLETPVFDIPAVDDPRVMVSIPVPIKGRKTPLVLKVPRFDFIDEAQHDAIQAGIEGIDESLIIRKKQRLVTLAMLKPFLSAADYKVCDGLVVGQLNLIQANWSQQSAISLGESLASAGSSTENTEAHSPSTSTPEGGHGGTLAAV
jgi:hypothetical protein